jgi:hypothetical protein
VDDVVVVGKNNSYLLIVDAVCRRFEAMSGPSSTGPKRLLSWAWAGGLAGQAWPLLWISSPVSLKIFGVVFATSLMATISLS